MWFNGILLIWLQFLFGSTYNVSLINSVVYFLKKLIYTNRIPSNTTPGFTFYEQHSGWVFSADNIIYGTCGLFAPIIQVLALIE